MLLSIEQIKDNINAILAGIEDRDPRQINNIRNGLLEFMQSGGVSMEDLNRVYLFGAFDIAKKRRMVIHRT
jgi:hypothetical protein